MHLDRSVNKECVKPFLGLRQYCVLAGMYLSSSSVDG